MVIWHCRNCGQLLQTPESMQGQVVMCSRCQAGSIAPAPEPPIWHYLAGNQAMGPYTAGQLGAFVADGTITPQTLIWRVGQADWQPYHTAITSPQAPYTPTGKRENYMGLNQGGLVLFIVLLVTFWPLCWLPWVIKGMKAQW